jgi:hypothetical protein
MKRVAPWLTLGAVLAIAVWQLHQQGRLWVCSCGVVRLWSGNTYGAENSQQLFDPYSFTHVLHGFMFFGLAVLLAPRLSTAWQFVIALSVESAWEILENSAAVIERYRAETVSLGYTGDSILNSFGDIAACALGAYLAFRLGLKRTFIVAVIVEAVLIVWIRDSLILNIVMLLYPLPRIKAWQLGI